MRSEFEEHGNEINSDGVRETQPYIEVQSSEYINFNDFRLEDHGPEDQEALPSKGASRRKYRRSNGEESAAAGSGMAALGATFVALIVVAAVIVPEVTDAGTDIEFVYVVSGSSEIDFEITISDFEGDAAAIFVMQDINQVFMMDAGNGTYSAAVKGLQRDTEYVIEVRSGIPALHVIESYTVRTTEYAPSTVEAELQYAHSGLTTMSYAVTVNDYNDDMDVSVQLTHAGFVIHTEILTGLSATGVITGLEPETDYEISVVEGTSLVNSWAVSTRALPSAGFDSILYDSTSIEYEGTVEGAEEGDDIQVVVTDAFGNAVDTYSSGSSGFSHRVTGLKPGTEYRLQVECDGIAISALRTVTTETS